ncbi:YceI family protein [Corynebacterium renale]|uniref:YceI family protein n=1 Tax=Corynebacterium renale TaxID=1724 RepID=UPI000DFEE445|nr:YceI family protein [Corynebacterium renale]STC95861.1 putative secreted protein [Corynebacterium renale]
MRQRKLVTTIFVVAIILIATVSVLPTVISAMMGPGVKTEGLSSKNASPAETELDGEWSIVQGSGDNTTSVGYTFHEVLPGDKRITSGSTQHVEGSVTISGETLTAGEVIVDMQKVASDNERRDINVRMKVLETDTFPTAEFHVTRPVELSHIPADGTTGTAELTGELTIHGVTQEVTTDVEVLRDGTRLIVSGDVPITRSQFDVETPDFIAASIDDQGELNIRLAMEKK